MKCLLLFQNIRDKKGFSLIELLVGLLLMITVGSIVLTIFFATLRGANKTASLEAIRQNGSHAINQISRAIRSAKSFDGVSLNGVDTFSTYCVVPDGPTPPFIQYKAVQVTTFDDVTEVYRCPLDDEEGLYVNDQSLIDQGKVIVSPQNACYFICIQTASSGVPTIGINFTLSTNVQSSSPDIRSTLPFQTTVSPRNFAR